MSAAICSCGTIESVSRQRWTVIVPVKAPASAKSRLAPALEPWRTDLACSMAADTVDAVLSGAAVDRVVVVGDSTFMELDVPWDRVDVLADPFDGHDLNGAISAAAQHLGDPAPGLAVLTADLPALRGEEIDAALTLAHHLPVTAVPDADGTGTTLLTARPGAALEPRFGSDSFAAHLRGGATALPARRWPGLVRDVDVPDHLEVAAALGLGPRTAAVLRHIRRGRGVVA